jgi:hypothetical protein
MPIVQVDSPSARASCATRGAKYNDISPLDVSAVKTQFSFQYPTCSITTTAATSDFRVGAVKNRIRASSIYLVEWRAAIITFR